MITSSLQSKVGLAFHAIPRAGFHPSRRFPPLSAVITPHHNDGRCRKDFIPPRKAFAATLRWLATGGCISHCQDDFGMARSTLQKHAKIVVNALYYHFKPTQIKWPTGGELTQVFTDFEQLCGLPLVAGAIDGSFIEFTKPKGPFASRYWCYKNKIAILLLAVVDATGRFTYVNAGRPASLGDAAAFRRSSLKRMLDVNAVFPPEHAMELELTRDDGSTHSLTLRPYLLGDEAFPLLSHMMRCYKQPTDDHSANGLLNRCIIQGRREVERAFGRLKARWRILLRRCSINDPDYMAEITAVCCALHNYCENMTLERIFGDLIPVQPESEAQAVVPPHPAEETHTGKQVREALRDYIATKLQPHL